MPLYSCSSSCHLPTQLLQLCPLRSAFIHTTTLILGSTHCSSSNKRSQSQRPYHTYTETTALASHPCSNRIQNLPPHVSHPFPNLSIIHVIHGYAMLCFQVQRTPIIHVWGFCSNSHKSEVQRRQSGLKSGGSRTRVKKFRFSGKISEKFRFFQAISQPKNRFSGQISDKIRVFFR